MIPLRSSCGKHAMARIKVRFCGGIFIEFRSAHQEIISKSHQYNHNLGCNRTFPIDLVPNRISLLRLNQKIVNTIKFWFDLTRFRIYYLRTENVFFRVWFAISATLAIGDDDA